MDYNALQPETSTEEDIGSKWTLGALLRYLKEQGINTKGVMQKIEDVIVKTIISVRDI